MMPDALSIFRPQWPAPPGVAALVTTRAGGVSRGPYAALNLASHVGDDVHAVAENRRRLQPLLPSPPVWLEQVHGSAVACLVSPDENKPPVADAALSRVPGVVCAVLTADCLPVLLTSVDGRVVAAAHAGWRGLQGGVLEATVAAMAVPAGELMAWLGPAIGPAAFEVGAEVRDAFVGACPAHAAAFRPGAVAGKWMADLFVLARQRLEACGVGGVYGGGVCTWSDAQRFFSYRRDGRTGRFATLIWRA